MKILLLQKLPEKDKPVKLTGGELTDEKNSLYIEIKHAVRKIMILKVKDSDGTDGIQIQVE